MSTIIDVHARQIFDSRGNPTIEVTVGLENGVSAAAGVPSGASTGSFEAIEMRDGGSDYHGKGVLQAIENVNLQIFPAIEGMNVTHQSLIDTTMRELDGTENKSRFGANAILGVSLAVARAAAAYQKIPLFRYFGGAMSTMLPIPMMNVLNGGAHGDNDLDIQEFMIVPIGARSFSHAMKMGTEIYHELKKCLKKQGLSTNVGDEGGFAPCITGGGRAALDLIMTAIEQAKYKVGSEVVIALDVAATEFYKLGKYAFEGKECDGDGMIAYYQDLIEEYPIISIEDPLAEEDWQSWSDMNMAMGKSIYIVGDDLLVTNPKRLQKGIDMGAANAILVKPNQIGTLTETLEVIVTAQRNGWRTIISHRSGETEDTTIADLAVGCGTGFIKTGAPCRSDRMAKYNRLLKIEEELDEVAIYGGCVFTQHYQHKA